MDKIATVNSETFENEVIKNDIPVLVDFWAEWCAPCKMMEPAISDVANEYAGKIKICKANINENMDFTSQYEIMGVPAILIFKNGEMVSKQVGLKSKNELKKIIDDVLD